MEDKDTIFCETCGKYYDINALILQADGNFGCCPNCSKLLDLNKET